MLLPVNGRGALVLAALAGCACSEEQHLTRARLTTDAGSVFGTGGVAGTANVDASGSGCGALSNVGECAGSKIRWCENGAVRAGDCRDFGAECTCSFDSEQQFNDCLCATPKDAATDAPEATGDGAGGGGTGGVAGDAGREAEAGPMCQDPGAVCANHSECCGGGSTTRCVNFPGDAIRCATHCSANSLCATRCCLPLTNGGGVCAALSHCGGAGCRAQGSSCDRDSECCDAPSNVCAHMPGDTGPGRCAAPCTSNTSCSSGCCASTTTLGRRSCAPARYCTGGG